MKKILSALLLVAIVGGFIAYKMWTKPHTDMQSASSDLTISAMDIYSQFSDDEEAANANYLDKVVEVSGTVVESNTEDGTTKVMLAAGDEAMGGVYCELDPLSTHKRTDFVANETIRLKCNCTGFTMVDVQMTRCVEAK